MSSEPDAHRGELLAGRYEIVRVLGEGALGRTMLALDRRRGDGRVAIKELLPSRMKRWKDFELFHRECDTLQSLSHAGIPNYYEDFVLESEADAEETSAARPFLVQEYVDGRSLQDMIDDGESFAEDQVRDWLVQALQILDYLHGLNPPVVHRDIKPANIMVTEKGRVMLVDFGAVTEAVTADGLGSTIVGTFGYMPPEQYAGMSVPATDLFALGATCVQLLAGTPPGELFEGIHEFRLPGDLPVTVGFEKILLRLTEPDVEDRYGSAGEVLEELSAQFLMVPKETTTGLLPIPYQIRPAPRPFPGFYLRDAYHGFSHLAVVLLAALGVALSLVFPITVIATGQPAWAIMGFFGTLVAILMAVQVSRKPRTEIGVYRRGVYTLGEITARFISTSSDVGAHLTYRYRVGDGFQYGCVSTRDAAYSALSLGDPVGVIYLPDEDGEHVLYAVPTAWSNRQTVGLDRRFLVAEDD